MCWINVVENWQLLLLLFRCIIGFRIHNHELAVLFIRDSFGLFAGLLALNIERLIAAFSTFNAKSILPTKFRFFLLFFLLVPFILLYSIIIPFSARVIPYAREDVRYACHFDYGSIFGKIFKFSILKIVFGLHAVLGLIVSIILFFKLYLSKRNSYLNSKSKEIPRI